MSSSFDTKFVDQTRLGEYAPLQPLSGKTLVAETFAVNGLGRGAYVRTEPAEKVARH